jgi:tRNA nucleotidyltransferase (CCA-adding enzyme)
MSDYIYMLESRLSPDQNRAVAEVQEAAGQVNANVFLTGGAMRDMLAGFRIGDLDFAVEGNAVKLGKSLAERPGVRIVSADEHRKSVELVFPGGITAQVAMSRQEKYARPGARPQVTTATIQEDLRGRDFTANAMALSLNKASRGLLLDPMNGLADIGRRELRAVDPYGFYNDPSRLLRLVRYRVRLGFTVEERTAAQVANAREAGMDKLIPPHALGEELKRIAGEDNPAELLRALDEAGLLALFSAALAGPSLPAAAMARWEKALHLVPNTPAMRAARLAPFLHLLTEDLTPREKQALIKATELSKADVDQWQKLEARSRKLAAALRSTRIRKPSQVYHLASAAQPDEVLFLLVNSNLRAVQERLRNHFQKYLPAVQEITGEEWAALEGKPGTPRRRKAESDLIANRLDRRAPKPEDAGEVPAPPPAAGSAIGGTGTAVGTVEAKRAR